MAERVVKAILVVYVLLCCKGWAITNVGRTCSPTPLFVHYCAKSIIYFSNELKNPKSHHDYEEIYFQIHNDVNFSSVDVKSYCEVYSVWLNSTLNIASLFSTFTQSTLKFSDVQISPRKKLFFPVHSANKNSQTRKLSRRKLREISRKLGRAFFLRAISR